MILFTRYLTTSFFVGDFRYNKPKLLGVSGQISFEKEAELVEEQQRLIITEANSEQRLSADSFTNEVEEAGAAAFKNGNSLVANQNR